MSGMPAKTLFFPEGIFFLWVDYIRKGEILVDRGRAWGMGMKVVVVGGGGVRGAGWGGMSAV